MENNTQNFHGSDLEKIELAYGISKDQILNFSSNVNPLGLSDNLKKKLQEKIELIASYPDRDYVSLRTSISQYTNVNLENIIVGNGSTELISLFIKSIQPKNAVIVGPTYSEYEREISLAGGLTTYYELLEENNFIIDINSLKSLLDDNIDLLVLCNPNNPTSTAIKNGELKSLIEYCKSLNIFVMIDETYVEFVTSSNVSAVKFTNDYNNLFIIRGVSKFFAAPGIRLGYAICSNKECVSKINNLKNPWTINSLAAYAGEIMLLDEDYIDRTYELINNERNKIVYELSTIPTIKFYQPEANFVLVKILEEEITSTYIFEELLKNKIMVRDASNFPFLGPKFFRFCFLNPNENDLLIEHLKNIFIK